MNSEQRRWAPCGIRRALRETWGEIASLLRALACQLGLRDEPY